jgi:hypothetical protein
MLHGFFKRQDLIRISRVVNEPFFQADFYNCFRIETFSKGLLFLMLSFCSTFLFIISAPTAISNRAFPNKDFGGLYLREPPCCAIGMLCMAGVIGNKNKTGAASPAPVLSVD